MNYTPDGKITITVVNIGKSPYFLTKIEHTAGFTNGFSSEAILLPYGTNIKQGESYKFQLEASNPIEYYTKIKLVDQNGSKSSLSKQLIERLYFHKDDIANPKLFAIRTEIMRAQYIKDKWDILSFEEKGKYEYLIYNALDALGAPPISIGYIED